MVSDLQAIARPHAARMARAGDMFHNDSLRSQVPGRYTAFGENVGYATSIGQLHDAFMHSPSHRSMILSTLYGSIGIGVVWRDGYAYGVEVFGNGSPRRTHHSSPPRRHKPVGTDVAELTVVALRLLIELD
jgi:uncharacterized protein YkwD